MAFVEYCRMGIDTNRRSSVLCSQLNNEFLYASDTESMSKVF